MTRSISATNETASQAAVVDPIVFVKLEFDSGNVYVHSGLGDIAFGGNTYTGVGSLGEISPVEETAELSRSTMSLTLSGIPGTMIGILLNEHYQGNPATVYLGFLSLSTNQLLDTPFILAKGRIDTADIGQAKDCSITLTVESRLAAWDRPVVRRYNDADQQSRYPGDKGLQFVEQSTEKQINWGIKAS